MSTEKTLDLYEDPARARLPETGISFAEDTVGILLGHGHLTLKEE